MKFKFTFVHLVEDTYEAFIEADSQEEAKELFEESPFDYVDGHPIETQGLEITDVECEKVK